MMTTKNEPMKRALWSVYFKRHYRRRADLAPSVRPIAAEDALDILLAHEDQHRGARRRRALLECGAADLHDDRRTRAGLAQRVERLARELNVRRPVLDHVGTKDAPAAAALLHGDRQHDCVAVKTDDIDVHYDPRTHDSHLTVVARVNRRIEDMAPLVDPRRWKKCSDFFEKSDPIDPATRQPVPVDDTSRRWQLHEVFSVPNATFENILNIEFRVLTAEGVWKGYEDGDRPVEIDVRYSLYEALSFTFEGFLLPGVLERDSGSVHAVADRDQSRTVMTTEKTIRYRDLTPDDPVVGGIDHGQWLNYCAPAMLGLWIDEASQGRLCCNDA